MAVPAVPLTGCYVGSSTPSGHTYASYNTQLNAAVPGAHLAANREYYHIDTTAISLADVAAGAAGSLGWFSFRADTTAGVIRTWNSIAAGTYDSNINAIADALHTYGHPCFVTFNHEPIHSAHTAIPGVSTATWAAGTNPTAVQAATVASEWVAAYENFVNVIQARYTAQGYSNNISFAPILEHYYWQQTTRYAPFTQWIPGVGVDWLAIDTYGSATTADFYGAYKAFYDWAHANLSSTPLANCEVNRASASMSSLPTWLYTNPAASGSLNYDMPNKMPQMKLWFYWNNGGAQDWTASPADITAMANLTLDAAPTFSGMGTAPVNTVAPTLGTGGHPVVGVNITGTLGTWTGTPTPTLSSQIQSSHDAGSTWQDIAGATSTTYVPGLPDVDGLLRIKVTGMNATSSVIAYSSATSSVNLPPDFPDLTISVTLE